MIDQAITELVQYGLDTGLVAPEDKIFVTNQILEALGLEVLRGDTRKQGCRGAGTDSEGDYRLCSGKRTDCRFNRVPGFV